MWRVVEDINNITNKSIWVIEKKAGFFSKKWTRDYLVGNSKMHSQIRSSSKSLAIRRMEILAKGSVLEEGEIIEI